MALRVRSLTIFQVVEEGHVATVGVYTLHPAVERLVEVIEVVLSETVVVARLGSMFISHALDPAVVLAKGLGEVVTKSIESTAEVACTSADVVRYVPAVVRLIAVGAFLGGNLHEALLPVLANGGGVTARLLHGDSGEENVGDMVVGGGLLEGPEVGTTGFEGVAFPGEDGFEFLGDHLVDGEVLWAPATALIFFDATVEPKDGPIGTTRFGGLGCGGGGGGRSGGISW